MYRASRSCARRIHHCAFEHAALFALSEAQRRKTSMRWPTPKIIRKYAKMYDVSKDDLAGCFGFLVSCSGGYCAWVDTVRGAAGPDCFGMPPPPTMSVLPSTTSHSMISCPAQCRPRSDALNVKRQRNSRRLGSKAAVCAELRRLPPLPFRDF